MIYLCLFNYLQLSYRFAYTKDLKDASCSLYMKTTGEKTDMSLLATFEKSGF